MELQESEYSYKMKQQYLLLGVVAFIFMEPLYLSSTFLTVTILIMSDTPSASYFDEGLVIASIFE